MSSGARSDGYLSTHTFLKSEGDHDAADREKNYRRSKPPRAPRTSARPTEPPIEPPTDLPRSATTPPTTLLVTERVTLRAISWPVDNRPRETLVPKMVPTIAPIWPRTPPPDLKNYRRSKPPRAPRTSARPTEPPIEPPTDLPRSATTPPTTLLVTERVTLRAISWPVDNRPRETLVPKMVPTIAPIWPRTPP